MCGPGNCVRDERGIKSKCIGDREFMPGTLVPDMNQPRRRRKISDVRMVHPMKLWILHSETIRGGRGQPGALLKV